MRKKQMHGLSKTPEYKSWLGMKDRCYNKNSKKYNRYGGRGIRVCDRWKASFLSFLEDMGPRPSDKKSIDRINNDGDYEPKNCRWANDKEQQNNRSNNHVISHQGKTMTISEWAAEKKICEDVIFARKKLGWTDSEALTKPAHERKKKGLGVTKEIKKNGKVRWKAYYYRNNRRVHIGSFDSKQEALKARSDHESIGNNSVG